MGPGQKLVSWLTRGGGGEDGLELMQIDHNISHLLWEEHVNDAPS